MNQNETLYWHITLNGERIAEVINGEHGATTEVDALVYHFVTYMSFAIATSVLPENFRTIIETLYNMGAFAYQIELKPLNQ